MNPLGFLCDIPTRFSAAPAWAQLLTKATLILAVAWVAHFSLTRANPRWRTLLWRGVAVGLLLIAVWVPRLPGLAIRVPAPEPIAAQPVAAESAVIEPVVATARPIDPPLGADAEPRGDMHAVKGPREVPAVTVTTTNARHDSVALHAETAGSVRPLVPPLSWLVTLLGVWALGAALLAVRLAIGFAGLEKLLRTSQLASDELVAEVGRIAAARGCRRDVQVRSSRQISVPFMCGFRSPVLVLPERMCLLDYRWQLPGVIAHELAHVVSNDFAWNMALRAASILLWFHPLVWRIGSAHRAACDAVCDAVAASYLGDVAGYCRTLAEAALAGTAPLPALGLAMARTCDVRRRMAALQQRVFAAALSRRKVAIVAVVGLLCCALLAGARFVRADPPAPAIDIAPAEPQAKDGSGGVGKGGNATVAEARSGTVAAPQLVSISAETFGRLSTAEQRALLVRIYRRRLEQAQNLFYEVDATWKYYEDDDGHPGKPRKLNPSDRTQYRHWLLGDSFRKDNYQFANIGDAEPSHCSSYAQNAVEGVARVTRIDKTGKTPPSGEIQYPNPSDDGGDDYIYWFDHRGRKPSTYLDEYLFPYLIGHQDQFEIKAPIADGKVQLTVPWQPLWAEKPGGKRVYVLDPQKGFLPIRCDSRWDDVTLRVGGPQWRIERLEVQESRLVGDVWLPTRLTNEVATPSAHKLHTVCELKVWRIEPGSVKPGDFFLSFTAGMQVRDTIEGVTYVADAQGNAVDPKFDPDWKCQPPAGWSKRASSMLSRFSPTDRAKLDAEKKSLDEKESRERRTFETALKVMRSSAPLDERVEAGLKVLRSRPIEIGRDVKPWASIIRELIEIGKPAVPKLTAELDRTEKDKMLRDLGFVLRGIGDPRAAPALIRAIPRLLKGSGDDGLAIEGDPKLAQFMREHDSEYRGKPGESTGGLYFSYGTPLREIMPALEKITGRSDAWRELRFVNPGGGREQQRLQSRLFLQLAERWADWWSKNWRKFVESEAEAQLGQTGRTLEQVSRSLAATSHQAVRSEFPRGPNVVADGGSQNGWTPSFDEHPADAFWDLDTGRYPNPPPNLVKTSAAHEPSKQLLAWAEAEGVDLVTVKTKASDGKWYYAFKPLGMKVWRIENSRFANLEKELHESRQFLLPAPWEGLLAPVDERTGKYDEKLTVSFLFITKEGTCGALQIVPPLSGEFGANGYTSAGLRCTFIYEKQTER